MLYYYTHIGNCHKSNNTPIGIKSVITDQTNVMKLILYLDKTVETMHVG